MDDGLQKALKKKAGTLLARRSYSRGELKLKLAKTAGDPEIEEALNRLEQLNLLNDAEYAYNFALNRIQREGWSPAKAREALLRRYLSQAVIESALQRVRNELGDEPGLIERIQKRCGKKGLPADPKDIRKLVFYLRRCGFDENAIICALKRMMPSAAMQHFETGE